MWGWGTSGYDRPVEGGDLLVSGFGAVVTVSLVSKALVWPGLLDGPEALVVSLLAGGAVFAWLQRRRRRVPRRAVSGAVSAAVAVDAPAEERRALVDRARDLRQRAERAARDHGWARLQGDLSDGARDSLLRAYREVPATTADERSAEVVGWVLRGPHAIATVRFTVDRAGGGRRWTDREVWELRAEDAGWRAIAVSVDRRWR